MFAIKVVQVSINIFYLVPISVDALGSVDLQKVGFLIRKTYH